MPLLDLSEATISARVDYRLHRVPGFWHGRPSREPVSEFWMRFADGRDADPVGLAMLVDAAAPVALDLGVAGSSTVELTVHVRARPAPGWLACRAAARRRGAVAGRRAGAGHAGQRRAARASRKPSMSDRTAMRSQSGPRPGKVSARRTA
ncbi:hypothetical protein [Prauserella halophila]|uniref:hypothetical protein n=1 Tax=Prauserella halophila TaxID=185641 RepID=UPI003CD08B6B